VGKITFTGLLLSIAITSIAFAQEITPEDTEIWEPAVVKVTPGTHGKAPSDAISLNHAAWESEKGGANPWTEVDGVMTIKPGTGGIQTKMSFSDVQLHVEWRSPILSEEFVSQDRGNSGVFLQEFYEVQVLDSNTGTTYANGQAGSIYKQYPPLVNVTKPPMEWQSYDIIYSAPTFDVGGNVEKKATMTVLHNGIVIQNHSVLRGPSVYIGHPKYQAHGDLPIHLQDHSHEVSFRNMWVRKL
jgi:hypothetical protein